MVLSLKITQLGERGECVDRRTGGEGAANQKRPDHRRRGGRAAIGGRIGGGSHPGKQAGQLAGRDGSGRERSRDQGCQAAYRRGVVLAGELSAELLADRRLHGGAAGRNRSQRDRLCLRARQLSCRDRRG